MKSLLLGVGLLGVLTLPVVDDPPCRTKAAGWLAENPGLVDLSRRAGMAYDLATVQKLKDLHLIAELPPQVPVTVLEDDHERGPVRIRIDSTGEVGWTHWAWITCSMRDWVRRLR
jgi:hypothetical protein